ncbi:unnamed protein product [Alopecurus aequalis]
MAAALFWFALGWWAGNKRNRETVYVMHHVTRGGCFDEFKAARSKCRHLGADDDSAEAEACLKATAALRKCFARNPDWFGDDYILRMDKYLDQHTRPTPAEIAAEEDGRPGIYRWWTGMRRS